MTVQRPVGVIGTVPITPTRPPLTHPPGTGPPHPAVRHPLERYDRPPPTFRSTSDDAHPAPAEDRSQHAWAGDGGP